MSLWETFLLVVLVGFIAELIDGSIGMAYLKMLKYPEKRK